MDGNLPIFPLVIGKDQSLRSAFASNPKDAPAAKRENEAEPGSPLIKRTSAAKNPITPARHAPYVPNVINNPIAFVLFFTLLFLLVLGAFE